MEDHYCRQPFEVMDAVFGVEKWTVGMGKGDVRLGLGDNASQVEMVFDGGRAILGLVELWRR